MPYSSSAFTSAASVKRGGGCECWSAWMRSSGTLVAGLHRGSLRPSSSSSALFWSFAFLVDGEEAGFHHVVPLARRLCSPPAARSTVTVLSVGDHLGDRALPDQVVELALVVAQERAMLAGVRSAEVGRTASCASCAFFDLVW